MREIRKSGSEGGAAQINAPFLPLSGIIVCTRDDADPAAFARRIHSAIVNAADPVGQPIRVIRPSS